MEYFTFVRENRRFLAFGLVLAWISSFGQTYFIALFSADIRAAFGLSHGGFGSIYSIATLASGLCLIWLGRQIDHVDLRLYSALVCAGLIAACFFMAATPSVALLYLAIFTLRLTGQGLMAHVSFTSMARYFDDQRGKAVSIATVGRSAGDAVFPLMAVALIATVGWRGTWIAIGAVLAVGLVPLVLWLLRGHGERHRRLLGRAGAGTTGSASAARQWSRGDVLHDSRFYLILPAAIAPAFIMTGLFFHQVHLVESKGWSLTWFASCYIGYGAGTLAASLLSGPLIDRVGATRLFPFHLLPMGLALLVLAAFDHPAVALIYMIAAGVTAGASFTIVSAMWPESYGVAHLGAIRALVSAFMVFSTALSPVSMGWLIDLGVTIEAIAVMCLGYVAAATALAAVANRPPTAR